MSRKKTSLRTKDILIEICPECNALHTYQIKQGLIARNQKNVPCGTKIGETEPRKANEEPKDILCDYVIEPKEENTFTIRRWSYRERQNFYSLVGAFDEPIVPGSTQSLKMKIKPEIMDAAIFTGIVNSPVPLGTKTDLDNADLDGAILEALYTEILDFNTPPLAQSSTSRRLSTRTTRRSARTMS